jgi:hypothetical protein
VNALCDAGARLNKVHLSLSLYLFLPPPPLWFVDVEWAEVLQDTDLVTKRSLFEFTAIDIDGQEVPLSRFAGQVCLVVNVACE